MDEFKAQVAALLRTDAYPLRVHRIRCKPTHMAMVFLTDRHAWKLRRPLLRGGMDFRTRTARERDALSEAGLDAHFAPGVCLGIARLQPCPGNAQGWVLRHPADPLAVEGEPVVCMRRLPASGMLDHLVRVDRVRQVALKRGLQTLACRLSQRHRYDTSSIKLIDHHRQRGHQLIDSLRNPIYRQPSGQLQEIGALLQACIDRQREALATRARSGRIRDGHGDLRPEHVCLEGAWVRHHGPAFIDALEFSDELRMLDPLQEVAGLAIECEFIGSHDIHARIREAWMDLDRHAPIGLWLLHTAQHALMRALHALWHLDTMRKPMQAQPWQERGEHWIRLARRQLLYSMSVH